MRPSNQVRAASRRPWGSPCPASGPRRERRAAAAASLAHSVRCRRRRRRAASRGRRRLSIYARGLPFVRATPFWDFCATCASRSCPRAPAGSRAVVCKRVRAYATVLAAFSTPKTSTGRCKNPTPNCWRCKQKLPLRGSRRSSEWFGTRSGRTHPAAGPWAQKTRDKYPSAGGRCPERRKGVQ